jgi:hypothetical protein
VLLLDALFEKIKTLCLPVVFYYKRLNQSDMRQTDPQQLTTEVVLFIMLYQLVHCSFLNNI